MFKEDFWNCFNALVSNSRYSGIILGINNTMDSSNNSIIIAGQENVLDNSSSSLDSSYENNYALIASGYENKILSGNSQVLLMEIEALLMVFTIQQYWWNK